ncbi:MAG: hypothetical protein KAJ19_14770, partial [Gammaproteobacteria bacterium]|nr:hypothetical protein [Gammaproteobacteria bacterium]
MSEEGNMRFRSSFLVALVLIALSFLISHSEAEAITLYSPSNGASLYKGNSITFDWGSVSGASYYEIWIDNHSSFGSPEVGFNNGVSPNWVNNGIVSVSQFFLTTSMQAQLPQNVYYWKVRALNSAKNDISGWSSIRSFSLLLKTPTGLNVVYQSANNWNYITWNSVFGATSYKIYWGTSSNVTTSSNSLSTGSTNYAHSGVVPGYCYYYKVAAVDSGGQSSLSSVDSACIPALKPDLVVQNQSASPTTVEAGFSTYISCTVKNQGSGSAASSYIKYYLSSNTTYDPSDTYLTSDYVSSLSSEGTSSESATVTIPSGTSTGTKYILFYADKDGAVSESDESNNVADKAITVTEALPAPPTLSSPADGSTLPHGSNITFSWVNSSSSVSNSSIKVCTNTSMTTGCQFFETGLTQTIVSDLMFTPGVNYHWQARSKTSTSSWGIYGPTPAWSFTVDLPAPPTLNLTAETWTGSRSGVSEPTFPYDGDVALWLRVQNPGRTVNTYMTLTDPANGTRYCYYADNSLPTGDEEPPKILSFNSSKQAMFSSSWAVEEGDFLINRYVYSAANEPGVR